MGRTDAATRFLALVAAARLSLREAASNRHQPAAAECVLEASLATARLMGFFDAITLYDAGLADQLLPEVEALVEEVDRLGPGRPNLSKHS